MAPRESRKARRQEYESVEEEEEEDSSQQTTQGDAMEVMKQASKLVEFTNARRDKKRKAIVAEHERRVKDLKTKIDTLFNNRKNRVTKSRQDLWKRLDALNMKRQNIEEQILKSMKTIEQASIKFSGELDPIFRGRINDIEMAG
ncbi:hypothetical protein LZ554_002253 [Drepanopeziza brunnea f. sp. 'monogermtubi']|nr:hypothetical protein LZ554_002253 [Drepanopeziza brunnea f. sp. 'monogermtubi']